MANDEGRTRRVPHWRVAEFSATDVESVDLAQSPLRDHPVSRFSALSILSLLSLLCITPTPASAQRDSTVLAGVHWREIGPYRGGRSVAVTGNP